MLDRDLKVNVLPSPTYRWLRMNEAYVSVPEQLAEPELSFLSEQSLDIERGKFHSEISDIAGGMGLDADLFFREQVKNIYKIRIAEGTSQCIRIPVDCNQEENQINLLYFELDEGASLELILDFHSDIEASGFLAMQTKFRLGKDAHVSLTQVQRSRGELCFLNDVAAKCEEASHFESIQLSLKGEQAYWASRADLVGKASDLKTDIGYLLERKDKLDMNYIVNHIGEKTECDIQVEGVLRDESFKLFRGTIDLRTGARDAKGNEVENVLLMDDGVINQTIPVILCTEDNVEGNHGATIGRIDDATRFYLESRGMEKGAVYELMAKAKVLSVVQKIPNEAYRNELLEALTGEEEAEETTT